MTNVCSNGLTSHRHGSFGMQEGFSLCERCGKVINRDNDEVPMERGVTVDKVVADLRILKEDLISAAHQEAQMARNHLAKEQEIYDSVREVEKRIIAYRKQP